jgi:hypothetical protein
MQRFRSMKTPGRTLFGRHPGLADGELIERPCSRTPRLDAEPVDISRIKPNVAVAVGRAILRPKRAAQVVGAAGHLGGGADPALSQPRLRLRARE